MSTSKRVNSRAKGVRGEQEAVKFLHRLGFNDARRTQQYNGIGLSDVTCEQSLPGLHIEVKFGYPLRDFDLGTKLFREAVEQCMRDCGRGTWVLLWKPKGHRQWRLTSTLSGVAETVCGDGDVKFAIELANALS